jgi:hypothetical protein
MEMKKRLYIWGKISMSFIPCEKRFLLTFDRQRYHGGGWCAGSNDSEELINRKICKALGVVVFSLDYRLAPENPFPTPFNDAEDGVLWVYNIKLCSFKIPHTRKLTCHRRSTKTQQASVATQRKDWCWVVHLLVAISPRWLHTVPFHEKYL